MVAYVCWWWSPLLLWACLLLLNLSIFSSGKVEATCSCVHTIWRIACAWAHSNNTVRIHILYMYMCIYMYATLFSRMHISKPILALHANYSFCLSVTDAERRIQHPSDHAVPHFSDCVLIFAWPFHCFKQLGSNHVWHASIAYTRSATISTCVRISTTYYT